MLRLAVQTGLRVSELTALTCQDAHLGVSPHVRCHGKGRNDRATPLTSQVVRVLKIWLAELGPGPGMPLFPTRAGARTGAARFLGYEITVQHGDQTLKRGRRAVNCIIRLRVPTTVIKAKNAL
ncbi:tyrosine-type recombinase/integrase [Nonomuraea sp. 3N208]|uniref:tyrosine-type recombinase/integrase n=1 Tax=Nonomuraea sp. 3N208 TaxID=3457421 RepID=UPI003FD523C8